MELFVLRCTVTQVEINQALIWDPTFFSQGAKILNRILVKSDGELLLRLLEVRVLNGFRKVVAFLHDRNSVYWLRSIRSAFLAEIMRMMLSLSL